MFSLTALWLVSALCIITQALGYTITTESFDIAKETGESVTFLCELDASWSADAAPLSWNRIVQNTAAGKVATQLMARNAEQYAPFDTAHYPKQNTPNTLTIKDLREDDAGVYMCSVGDNVSREHLLSISAPKQAENVATKALDYLESIAKKIGDSVTFQCDIDAATWDMSSHPLCYFKVWGNETKRLMSYNYGNKYPPFMDDRFVAPIKTPAGETVTSLDFTINNLALNDTGLYACVVGNSRVEYHLKVSEERPPDIISRALKIDTGMNSTNSSGPVNYLGDSVLFTCEVAEKYSDLQFFPVCWYKIVSQEQGDAKKRIMTYNYNRLVPFNGPRFPPMTDQKPKPGEIVRELNLLILNLKVKDSAMYVCVNGPNRKEHVLTVINRSEPVVSITARSSPGNLIEKNVGESVAFHCNVEGTNWTMESMPLSWYKLVDGEQRRLVLYNFVQQQPFVGDRFPQPVQPAPGAPVTSHILTIKNLQVNDTAIYACSVGENRVEYKLGVLEPEGSSSSSTTPASSTTSTLSTNPASASPQAPESTTSTSPQAPESTTSTNVSITTTSAAASSEAVVSETASPPAPTSASSTTAPAPPPTETAVPTATAHGGDTETVSDAAGSESPASVTDAPAVTDASATAAPSTAAPVFTDAPVFTAGPITAGPITAAPSTAAPATPPPFIDQSSSNSPSTEPSASGKPVTVVTALPTKSTNPVGVLGQSKGGDTKDQPSGGNTGSIIAGVLGVGIGILANVIIVVLIRRKLNQKKQADSELVEGPTSNSTAN